MKPLAATLLAAALALAAGGAAAQPSCGDLVAAYEAEIALSQRCEVGAPDACGATRPRTPQDACRCQVAVNPARTAELDRLLAQFDAQACPRKPPVCNRACTMPARTCTAAAGAAPSCAGR